MYQEIFTQMRKAYATSEAEEQQAAEEGLQLRDRMRLAYPFHPALLDLMRQRWASLPEYQRTRGALRFLAACLRAHSKAEKSGMVLGPGDVMLSDHEVRRAITKELSLMNRFDAVFQADLVGPNSTAGRIDKLRAKANPAETGKNVATRLATTIFLYSFGGLRREGAGAKEVLPPGVSEAEILAACIGPEVDSLTAKACLAELKQQCLYMHFDGVRFCFKQDPNVTLLVEQEADAVARDTDRVSKEIREMLEHRLAGHHGAIAWPNSSGEIPDEQPRFQIAYLPLDFATRPAKEKNSLALELVEKCGSNPRKYRNGLGLAIPAAEQAESLRREVRYLMAVERVSKASKKHNLTKEQSDELRERKATHASAAESAFVKLYSEVWLPKLEKGSIAIEKIAVGGRPLQTTLSNGHLAMVFERNMELLTQVQKRVFPTLNPVKVVELFKLGEGSPAVLGIRCSAVVSGFYSFLGFTRLTDESVVQKAVARGIREGVFAYYTGTTPATGEDGRYQVARGKVRFETPVTDDEVDLESGFIMMPQAVPAEPPEPGPGPEPPGPIPPGPGPTPPPPGPGPTPPVETEQLVEFGFTADRDQLYTAWNAIANLADMAGGVSVNIRAESEGGFDKSKLENGVMEPLRESDLIE